MKKAALILAVFLIPCLLIVVALFASNDTVTPPAKTTITIWGTKPESYFTDIIATYVSTRPYATIVYKQISTQDYKNQLVNAWAINAGPDIFEFPADEMQSYKQFLIPAPATTPSYSYEKIKRFGIKEETIITKTDVAGPTLASVRSEFVDTVVSDATSEGLVYGLPITIDSLVLFSNRTLLNQARIPLPATTWDSFVQQVPKMTILDTNNAIVQSGASIGTAENVNHAEDILALFILQNGGRIISASGAQSDINSSQAEQALSFYTDFAQPSKIVYSWDKDRDQALNAFASGTIAYYIGYASDKEYITQRSTGLNFDMSAIPQVNELQPVTIAKYGLFGVYLGTKDQATSWNFLQFMTGHDGGIYYHNRSLDAPARKDLIATLQGSSSDATLQMRIGQALTAVSWYKGRSRDSAGQTLQEMITRINEGTMGAQEALRDAAEQIRLTL